MGGISGTTGLYADARPVIDGGGTAPWTPAGAASISPRCLEAAGPGTIRRHDDPNLADPHLADPNLAALTSILLAVLGRFALSFIALAASLAALVSIAAIADGRAPEPRRLGQVIGGFAPAVAAIWVLLDLRRHGEDTALAALGARPGWTAALLLACAAPLFLLDRPARPATLSASPTRLEAPGLSIAWRDGAAWRSDLEAPFRGLPAPPTMPSSTLTPLFHAGLRIFALALGLLGLLRWREPPGLVAGLAVAGLVFWAGIA